MKKKKLPEFKTMTIEEIARFWDTHDFTDYEHEFEEVHEPVFDLRGRVLISIYLSRRDFELVQKVARKNGMTPSAVTKKWISERVREIRNLSRSKTRRAS